MSLVIQCGPSRRIVRYSHGWKIERKTEKGNWKEDSPAWPANLGQACQMVAERILGDRDGPICPEVLAAELSHAVAAVEHYFARARQIGSEFEADLDDETWNRHARAGDDDRKARKEGRLPTKAEQAELDELARRER